MENYKTIYQRWLNEKSIDENTKEELIKISDDEKEIEDRFYKELEFGTAGMRGVIGAGTNRINVYNIRRATMGVAKRVWELGEEAKKAGVLIGYDTRKFSKVFAEETAKVLCANGVKVYLFDKVHSVPEVSFGIRELSCSLGVMITASHNPKEYNGYKVYGSDGGQLPPDSAKIVIDAIDKCDIFDDVLTMPLDKAKEEGLLEYVGEELDEKFLKTIKKEQQNPEAIEAVGDTFKLLYTPFHGTGSRPIKKILNEIGFKNLYVVEEQDTEDENFSTVKSPNPEEKEGFTLAIKMAKENDIDLIIGTDPDCDRVGVVVRDKKGEYQVLTGNQTGALLCEYILSSRKEKNNLPKNSVVIKTIVTTELTCEITKHYGVEIMNVLTGFKYIGEKMSEFEKTKEHTYVFGFEESYGCLPGTYARDKDGVCATMLIAEMAAFYKTKNMSLYEAMEALYEKYGYFCEKVVSVVMSGKDGMENMKKLMENLRVNPPKSIAGQNIIKTTDYKNKVIIENGNKTSFDTLPSSDVMKFNFEDNKSQLIIRPSGTEPKVKFYISSSQDNMEKAQQTVEKILEDTKKTLNI